MGNDVRGREVDDKNAIHCIVCSDIFLCRAWWRHKMETFSALLALCAGNAGNSVVTDESPSQRPVTPSFDAFFHLRLQTAEQTTETLMFWDAIVFIMNFFHTPEFHEIPWNSMELLIPQKVPWNSMEFHGMELDKFDI